MSFSAAPNQLWTGAPCATNVSAENYHVSSTLPHWHCEDMKMGNHRGKCPPYLPEKPENTAVTEWPSKAEEDALEALESSEGGDSFPTQFNKAQL